jgi:hypothetical protein
MKIISLLRITAMLNRSSLTSRACFVVSLLTGLAGYVGATDQVAMLYPPVIQGEPLALKLDKSGARFVVGRFMGALDFNPGIGEESKTSSGGYDVYVTRFESNGSYAWTKTFGGSLIDFPKSVVLVGKTLYVGGTFASTDAGIGGTGSLAAKGLRDVFVWALDAETGTAVPTFGTNGLQTFGGLGTDNLQALTVSGPNLVLGGNFDSTDASIGGIGTVQAAHALDCYVLILNAKTGLANTSFGTDGAVTFGGSDVDEVAALAVKGSALYVTGNFKSLNFAFEGGTSYGPVGIRSAYILALSAKDGTLNTRFDGDGVLRFGGSADDRGIKIAVSGSNLFLAGNLSSQDAGVNATGTFSSSGMNDAFILALSAKNGTPNTNFGTGGFQKFGGTAEDTLGGLAPSSKAIYLAGTYESADAALGIGVQAAHVAKKDIFIMALNPKNGQLMSQKGFNFSLFGGSEDESASDICLSKKTVFVSGTFNSTNAGYGAPGSYNFANFGGLLLPFDALTGLLPLQ